MVKYPLEITDEILEDLIKKLPKNNREIVEKFKNKIRFTHIIYGCGIVGEHVAVLSAKHGNKTIGFDISNKRIEELKKKYKDIDFTTDVSCLKDADVITVSVPTNVKDYEPDFEPLRDIATNITSTKFKNVVLILNECTMPPGDTNDVFVKTIEEKGKKIGKGIFLCVVPERLWPGKYPLEKTSRIIGPYDLTSGILASIFYRKILNTRIDLVSNMETAEKIKTHENFHRFVNILLAYMEGKFCENLTRGKNILIDAKEVIDGASTKPFGYVRYFFPGHPGGGCLIKDAKILLYSLKKVNADSSSIQLIEEMLKIVDKIPEDIVESAIDTIKKTGLNPKNIVYRVVGISYREDYTDAKDSLGLGIIAIIREKFPDVKIEVFDPIIDDNIRALIERKFQNVLINPEITEENVCSIVTRNKIDNLMDIIKKSKFVIDCTRQIEPETVEGKYRGCGYLV